MLVLLPEVTAVKAGNELNYQLTLAANNSGNARALDISLPLLEGMHLIAINDVEFSVQNEQVFFHLVQAGGAAEQSFILQFATEQNISSQVQLPLTYRLNRIQQESVLAASVEILAELMLQINGVQSFSSSGKPGSVIGLAAQSNNPVILDWQQVSGPAINLKATSAEQRITLPDADGQTIILNLTATDSLGQTQTATASIKIEATGKSGGSSGWLLLILALISIVVRYNRQYK